MHLFLHSLSFCWFLFFPLRLFTSSETLVKDNIYRKPPIYQQHGTVSFLLWSGLCTMCCPSSVHHTPLLSVAFTHLLDSMGLHAQRCCETSTLYLGHTIMLSIYI